MTLLLTLPSIGAYSQDATYLTKKTNRYKPRIDVDYKWGNKRNLGRVDILIPVLQNDENLLFLDSRGWLDNETNKEGNIGLGFRRKINNELILGAYAFYDLRRTDNENRFAQGTLGLEALTINWDFRGNFYLPENGRKSTNSVMENGSAHVQGSNIFVSAQSFETSFNGFDMEIGRKTFFFEDLKIFAGYYHFWNNDINEKVDGFRARGEYDFFSKNGHSLSLEGEYSHDDLRSNTTFGGLRYSYRFGVSENKNKNKNRQYTLSKIEKRMTDRIIRDVDIVTKEVTGITKKLMTENDQEQMIIFVDNSTANT
ncbi:MAG: hypothetical protein ACJAW3_001063, partial [Lentimonas sp.]